MTILARFYGSPRHPGDQDTGEQDVPRPYRVKRVTVLHPGYTDVANTLFTLPTPDGIQRDRIHHATLMTACGIIASNRFDGWLSKTPEGTTQVVPDEEGCVAAGTYYFHVPRTPIEAQATHHFTSLAVAQAQNLPQAISTAPAPSSSQTAIADAAHPNTDPPRAPNLSPPLPNLEYPIVPNFRCWRFPHRDIPDHWQPMAGTDAAQGQVESCRVTLTSHPRAVDESHIIPASEAKWFVVNNMAQYGNLARRGGVDVADMSDNLIHLRRDIHSLWDAAEFIIVPKHVRSAAAALAWTLHALSDNAETLRLYHNVPLHTLSHPPEYLFARFAYDLFPKIIGLLQARSCWLKVSSGTDLPITKLFSHEECVKFAANQGPGRSTSPKKRKQKDDGDQREEDEGDDDDSAPTKQRRTSSLLDSSPDSAVGGLRDLDTTKMPHSERDSDANTNVVSRVENFLYFGDGDDHDPTHHRGRRRRRS
ncbi:hypothetical protein LTR35_017964 [Friedmanniomyces endolithicus]|nr:hypothetical protein LTR35_017964 [Friedmanniomyces endolithicus]KAK0267067.1 hypothetical protein LTS00_017879 [Friedmanniomyces endolithicus]KAK0967359.1 hypothetical protein LTR54_018280 [Friedmanniomyces endolithicus]